MRRLSAENQGAILGDDPCVLTISVSTRLYKMGGLWLLLLLGLGQRAGGQAPYSPTNGVEPQHLFPTSPSLDQYFEVGPYIYCTVGVGCLYALNIL